MNANTNDSTRSPFVVPGPGRAEPKTQIDTHHDPKVTRDDESRRQGSNPFVWVVPNQPPKAELRGSVTGNESPQPTMDSEPTLPGHDHGDAPQQSTQINNKPTTRPVPETGVHSSIPRRTIPTSGYVSDNLPEAVDDDRTSRTGHSEDEAPSPDETPWPGGTGPVDDGGHVTVSDDGGNRVDSTRLREGVQIGTVKRELRDFIHNPKICDQALTRKIQLLECKKKKRIPFSTRIPKILDFLTRWRLGTTVQVARVAGWRDSNERRIVKKLRVYDEVGFMRETDLPGGPKIWTSTSHGTELGFHPWLGGSSEINPLSLGHLMGLSSIASWLLCPWENSPNVLGLPNDEWNQVRGEITTGAAHVLAEKEVRAAYSSIRNSCRGLLPSEYRHGFIGYSGGGLVNPVHGAWREWALAYKTGSATLDESPELRAACDPEFRSNLWMWIIWGNGVWNPKTLEDRACLEEGIDLNDPEWSGRDGELRLRSEFRRYGLVDIEERLDIASNKPLLNKELGDRFVMWDHLPDMIIARKRDPRSGVPQSIAIELELTGQPNSDFYSRTMAAYGSPLGKTLYRNVIWLVPSKTIADRIRAGANKVGMILGEDYDIVPFVTSAKVTRIKKSFYTGSDILPGCWNKRGTIEPTMDGMSIPLS